MDVAITGSSGLIGKALRESLEADGHRVLRVLRSADGGMDTTRWDPETGAIDAAAFEGIDAVVHLAGEGIGEKRWTREQKDRIRWSRILGTELISRTIAGLDRPPAVLLSASGVGYYGDTGETVTDESGEAGDDFPARVCVEWEQATGAAVEAGLRVALMRNGVVVSDKGGAFARQIPFFKFGLGGKVGSGRQYVSWISLSDEVSAIRWLLDHEELAGPVNLCAPHPCTNSEMAKALAKRLHRPSTIIPKFGPKLLFGSELVDALLLTSQRVVPAALQASGFVFAHPRIDQGVAAEIG